MTRRMRVAGVVLGLVLLGGAVACGDDETDLVQQTTTSTTAGDGGVKAAPPSGDPSLVGAITQVSKLNDIGRCDDAPVTDPDDAASSDDADACAPSSASSLGSFVVRDGVDAKGGALSASVSVPTDIAILREDGKGAWALASFDDLTQGTRVQVWFEGPVAESYPVQATAGSIVIEA